MDKVPLSEHARRLDEAKAYIASGTQWQHYKGGKYLVTDLVIIELTDEIGVIYRSLANPLVTFMRPLVDWQTVVEHDGNKVYRFRQVGKTRGL